MKLNIPEPAVKRKSLIITAGVTWLAVGLFLMFRSYPWLNFYERSFYIILLTGLLAGYLKSKFVLSKIIKRNIERIKTLSPHKERICIFAFQALQSYIIVLAMIFLGIILRATTLPRDILATIYIAIGFGLFKSGFDYFKAVAGL